MWQMEWLSVSQANMDKLDPQLKLEFINYPDDGQRKGYDVVLVRDLTRASIQVWRIGSFVSFLPVVAPLSDELCLAIYRFFERARTRHPESYLTCSCHRNVRPT